MNYIAIVLVAVSTCIPKIKTENRIHRNAGVVHAVKLVVMYHNRANAYLAVRDQDRLALPRCVWQVLTHFRMFPDTATDWAIYGEKSRKPWIE
jgi:hypothetical protein